MRFSTSAILALPLLAAAAENPFEQYKAKFQNFISSFGASLPIAGGETEPAAAVPSKSKAKVGPKKIEALTLHDWKDTLYAPVKPDATVPEEWWVLVTGGNKSCFGRCTHLETAFNETALKFATLPKSPHLALLNCDEQPVLCNTWSASTGALWVFEMVPKPAPIDVYWKPFNLTSVNAQTLLSLSAKPASEGFRLISGAFHPFDGTLAQYNLAVPLGYALYAINSVPSWAMMLVVSFFSRSMMNRRMDPAAGRPGAPAPGAPGAAAAPRT